MPSNPSNGFALSVGTVHLCPTSWNTADGTFLSLKKHICDCGHLSWTIQIGGLSTDGADALCAALTGFKRGDFTSLALANTSASNV